MTDESVTHIVKFRNGDCPYCGKQVELYEIGAGIQKGVCQHGCYEGDASAARAEVIKEAARFRGGLRTVEENEGNYGFVIRKGQIASVSAATADVAKMRYFSYLQGSLKPFPSSDHEANT